MIFKVYTDGSYRDGIWGAGAIVLNEQNAVLFTVKESGADTTKIRNVAGEVMAVEKALRELFKNYKKKADKNNEKLSVTIYHDYEGLQKWADGEWKANKEITIAYKECIANARKVMDVSFVKVKAHSGDKFNSLADELARQALDDAGVTVSAENTSSTSAVKNVVVEKDSDTITIKVVFSRKELEAEYTPETLEETLKANLPVKEVIF